MLIRCIKAENCKLRGCIIWIAFLVIPLFPAIMGTFNYVQNIGILENGWYDLWTQHTLFYALIFFAPLVGLYAAYLWRLEHLGHNWNQIMTAPVPPFYLFLAKFIVVLKMALLTQIWVFLLFIVCGHLIAKLPGMPDITLFWWMFRGVLGSVGIIALQLILSMVIRSFAVPILLALAGGVAGVMMVNEGVGLYWPYALMLLGMNSNKTEDAIGGNIIVFLISCVTFTILFFAFAAGILKYRDVKA